MASVNNATDGTKNDYTTMLKKYESKSCISLSVILPSGGTTHVSFSPVSSRGSVFYTDNEDVQAGLESHPRYGKLFNQTALKSVGTAASALKSVGTAASAQKSVGTAASAKREKEVKMSCNDDAKDYLVEKFGISRTKLRSREQIEEAGIANGVKFVWA